MVGVMLFLFFIGLGGSLVAYGLRNRYTRLYGDPFGEGRPAYFGGPSLSPEPEQTAYPKQAVSQGLAASVAPPSLETALATIPRKVRLTEIFESHPPGTLSLPVGFTSQRTPIWLDLASHTLHVGLYAQSGVGKDTLLRCWFLTLCARNTPEEVQFLFLDGKGDWLTPNLAHRAHMFLPPAGGYGRSGDQRILDAIQSIDQEAHRRQTLIANANCRTREQYLERTGKSLPLLIVVATDVMTSVAGKVEDLFVNLISKARSLGIRVIISMQTPSGRDTRWRMNVSTVIVGALQSSSQDTPALGLEVREMRYRPSQFPSPQERPGVFMMRSGTSQVLVQGTYLSDQEFERLVELLPIKSTSSEPVRQPTTFARTRRKTVAAEPLALETMEPLEAMEPLPVEWGYPANEESDANEGSNAGSIPGVSDAPGISHASDTHGMSDASGGSHANDTYGMSDASGISHTNGDDTFRRSLAQEGRRLRGSALKSKAPALETTESLVLTPNELMLVVQAVQAYQRGTTREQAITEVFGCRKGSSKAYQRASSLFDVAVGKGPK